MAWQLQEAKAKFSELVQKAIDEGPQTVTRHGKDAVVVLSAEQFELMKKRQIDLKDLLPYLSLDEADLERNKDFRAMWSYEIPRGYERDLRDRQGTWGAIATLPRGTNPLSLAASASACWWLGSCGRESSGFGNATPDAQHGWNARSS